MILLSIMFLKLLSNAILKFPEKALILMFFVASKLKLEQLKKSRDRLKDYNRNLEQKVERRTLALKEANEKLSVEIAERKQAELALKKLNEELVTARAAAEAANEAKSRFLANVSHELRTPLNGILGYAQILKREEGITSEQRDGLMTIQQCGEHLLTLINDVLDLSKIEAKKMELNVQNFHFQDFIKSLVDLFKVRAELENISFVYSPTSSFPTTVRGDETRLRQVLFNLLSNALKFTPQGSITLKVGYLSPNNDKIRFQVEDTGIGIISEHLEEIFLPFHQLSNQINLQGTGLGLAISHKLSAMMGSELKVKSVPGQGSVFWLDLSLPEAIEEGQRKDKLRIVGYKGQRCRIVVDEDTKHRLVLVDMLSGLGFKTFEIAKEADWERGLRFEPDVVFLDWMIASEGAKKVEEIKRSPNLTHTIIIATSAFISDNNRRTPPPSCHDFIAKPYQRLKLLETLQHHLALEWIYKNVEVELETSSNFDFVIPPQDEMEVLQELAKQGDIGGIIKQTEKLESDPNLIPFILELKRLAKSFQEKKVSEFIKQYLADDE